jgi:hypothetical protein
MHAFLMSASLCFFAFDEPPVANGAAHQEAVDPKAMFDGLPLETNARDIHYLLQILKNSPQEGHRATAARMLGQMRAPNASKVLMEHIELRSMVFTNLSPLSTHPAAQALVAIGSPVYPDLFAHCGRELSDKKVRILAYVVRGIDGKEVGVFRLRDKLDKYQAEMRKGVADTGFDLTNPDLVRNLERLIELVGSDELDNVKNFPWASPR